MVIPALILILPALSKYICFTGPAQYIMVYNFAHSKSRDLLDENDKYYCYMLKSVPMVYLWLSAHKGT